MGMAHPCLYFRSLTLAIIVSEWDSKWQKNLNTSNYLVWKILKKLWWTSPLFIAKYGENISLWMCTTCFPLFGQANTHKNVHLRSSTISLIFLMIAQTKNGGFWSAGTIPPWNTCMLSWQTYVHKITDAVVSSFCPACWQNVSLDTC